MLHRHKYIYFILLLIVPLLVLISYSINKTDKQKTKIQAQTGTPPTTTVIAKNLDVPWGLVFLPDKSMLFTERAGKVKLWNNGQITDVATINDVKQAGESGLLGIALHPQFATNKFVYLYSTYAGGTSGMSNKVVRYTFTNNQLTSPTTIVDGIPGAEYHDGGRLKFGPDGFLYITTGDATVETNAQDTNSLGGKILRVKDDGTPAPGNPFNNRVYSYGHRNPQGLAWDGTTLYETEHGNSQPSQNDEINKIEMGKNYGWPTIEGDAKKDNMLTPLANSGTDGTKTWAPSGTAFYNGSVFFAALKGEGLYEATVQGTTATIKNQLFKNQFGRIRDVVIGPDNMLYILTNNKDGRGSPKAEDDKIIKVDFGLPAAAQPPAGVANPSFGVIAPCASCNKPTIAQVSGGPVIPSAGEAMPTTAKTVPSAGVIDPISSVSPCPSDSSISDNKKGKKKSKHTAKKGGVSKGSESILKLFMQLLNLLLKVLGGGQLPSVSQPNPVTSPQPCPSSLQPSESLPMPSQATP